MSWQGCRMNLLGLMFLTLDFLNSAKLCNPLKIMIMSKVTVNKKIEIRKTLWLLIWNNRRASVNKKRMKKSLSKFKSYKGLILLKLALKPHNNNKNLFKNNNNNSNASKGRRQSAIKFLIIKRPRRNLISRKA